MSVGIRAAEWSLRELERFAGKPPAQRIAEYFAPAVRDSGGQRFAVGLTGGNWCAAGACFAAAQCIGAQATTLEAAGVPHAYRVSGLELEQDAIRHGAWLLKGDATPENVFPGDLVILNRGDPQSWTRHVGRVLKPGAELLCIDGNASGGGWKIVRRPLRGETVRGFVRYPRDAGSSSSGDALALCAALFAVAEVLS